MKSKTKLYPAVFVKRYKRFFADVIDSEGNLITLHCPNTGSMKNCLEIKSPCWYSLSDNPKRKLRGTLEIVTTKYGQLAGINTISANRLVRCAIETQLIPEFLDYDTLRSEVTYGDEKSRIDFLLQDSKNELTDCYVEVKNVTLDMGNGLVMFPDSVTNRGAKHLRELIAMVDLGYRSVLLFCVQVSDAKEFDISQDIDPTYAKTLELAIDCGVEVFAWRTSLSSDEGVLEKPIKCLNLLRRLDMR